MTIHIFVGTCDAYASMEPVLEYSIRKHTSHKVKVHFMRPKSIGMENTGCTTFSNTRFAVPELGRAVGAEYAVYVDVDMLFLSDVADLFAYKQEGKWVCLQDNTDEVAVIDCSINMPPVAELHNYKKWDLWPKQPRVSTIPMTWNCEDPEEITDDMNLIHWTDLYRQPWFTPERDDVSTRLLSEYTAESLAA